MQGMQLHHTESYVIPRRRFNCYRIIIEFVLFCGTYATACMLIQYCKYERA
jgi:hypothetical protein